MQLPALDFIYLVVVVVIVPLPIWVAAAFIWIAIRRQRFGIVFLLLWTFAEAVSLAMSTSALSVMGVLPTYRAG